MSELTGCRSIDISPDVIWLSLPIRCEAQGQSIAQKDAYPLGQ
jgi:hypothetical protein